MNRKIKTVFMKNLSCVKEKGNFDTYLSLAKTISFRQLLRNKSLGNHEFDDAVEGLVPFIRNVTTPVLAANLILDNVPELQNEPNLLPSIVITINDVQIGIIGYLTPDTKFLAPKNKVIYENEISALKREVSKLRKQGVNILIALGHSGIIKDLEIARKVEGIDLVIGGHSNTFMWNGNFNEKPEIPDGPYPTNVKQESGRIVPVVQAYAYTKYLGHLHIVFDTNGEIVSIDGTPILLNMKVPRDPDLLKIVDKYRNRVNIISSEVVGKSTVFLNGHDCRLRECNIGNIINDALLYYTNKIYPERGANIAITQGGRIRTSIKLRNNLTKGDWINVLPFTDPLSIVTMNGTVLKQALEHSVDAWTTIGPPGQYLQFSNMEVIYDLSRPPGSRVVDAKAVCSDCPEPILSDVNEEYEYNLIMSTFLADGGDGYEMFGRLEKETLPYNEIDCIIDYLKIHNPISPRIEGRSKLLNEDTISSKEGIISHRNGKSVTIAPSSANRFSLSSVTVLIIGLYKCLFNY